MVPGLHDTAHVRTVADRVLQLGVSTDDFLKDHGDVVLVGGATLHLHGGTDGDGRDHDVGEDEVFGTAGVLVDPDEREIFGRNAFEQI